MSIVAIIPMKDLERSKSRLKHYLTSEERRELSISMLRDVVTAIDGSKWIDDIYVITPDKEVERSLASNRRVKVLFDEGIGQIHAVEKAIRYVTKHGLPEIIFISVADIPLLRSKNVDEILIEAINSRANVLAPSIDGGTNIITQYPMAMIKLMYGENSFEKHLKQARIKGMKVSIYESPEASLDIDTVEDLLNLLEISCHGYTSEILRTIGERIAARSRGT